MTPDEQFRALLFRVIPVAFIAFALGGFLLHTFMKSLRDTDDPSKPDAVAVSGRRFFILVLVLFALAMLFVFFSYQ